MAVNPGKQNWPGVFGFCVRKWNSGRLQFTIIFLVCMCFFLGHWRTANRINVCHCSILHHDMHDFYWVWKCCCWHGSWEGFCIVHDDHLITSVCSYFWPCHYHHPQHDSRHSKVPWNAGWCEGVHDSEWGSQKPDGKSDGLYCLKMDEHQGGGAGQSAQYLSKGHASRYLCSSQQVRLVLFLCVYPFSAGKFSMVTLHFV